MESLDAVQYDGLSGVKAAGGDLEGTGRAGAPLQGFSQFGCLPFSIRK